MIPTVVFNNVVLQYSNEVTHLGHILTPDLHDKNDIINPRRACAARVTVVGSVCLSVCVSVKSHLTSGASVRPENAVTYSAGNEVVGFSLKPLRCRDPALPPLTAIRTVGHFSCGKH